MSITTPRLLVTGAGGQFGRRVVELLLDAGTPNLVAASRDTARLADLVARGAEAVAADFNDPASLDAAFAGIDRLLIVSTDALGEPGLRLRQHQAAVAAAVRAGVSHIVYTSMPNPEPVSPIGFAPDHHQTELALAASGVPHTILRNGWYMENLVGSLPHVLATGTWYTSAGDGRVAHVARADAAHAAAAALTSATGTATHTITGPTAYTTDEIAAIASEAFDRPISVVQVSDEQLAGGLAAAGMPPFVVDLVVSFDANTRAGRIDIITDAVERLTGQAPQTLAAFFAANRAALLPTA